jgi:hypothetical protein
MGLKVDISRLTSIVGVTVILSSQANAGWRDQRIDGTSAAAFEKSIALVLNELPRRRREEFTMALAAIWYKNSVDAGDFDHEGDTNTEYIRLMTDNASDLLAQIDRGDLLAAIEDREVAGSDYTSTEYIKQLDGLQFDDVLDLAELPGIESLLASITQESTCNRSAWPAYSRNMKSASRVRDVVCSRQRQPSNSAPVIGTATFRAIEAANEALEAQQYAAARAAIQELDVDTLSVYERSMAERVLAVIANTERRASPEPGR